MAFRPRCEITNATPSVASWSQDPMRVRRLALTLALAVLATSCRKHPRIATTPLAPKAPAAESSSTAPPVLEAPPPIPLGEVPQTGPPLRTELPTTKPPRLPRRRNNKPAADPKTEAQTLTQPAAPPAESPRLGQILTPTERQDYERRIGECSNRARQNLAMLKNHKLTTEQNTVVNQISNFLQQAQDAQPHDLPAAKSLAERADFLSQNLVSNLN